MRFAIQQRVPIVPVATVGGHDTVFVLSEGRFIAKWSGLGKRLRGATMPIISGFPFPLAVEILPMHLPLPAKIRTELLEPIELDTDPTRSEDDDYVSSIYREVEAAIQAGMDRLAEPAKLPDLRLKELKDVERTADRFSTRRAAGPGGHRRSVAAARGRHRILASSGSDLGADAGVAEALAPAPEEQLAGCSGCWTDCTCWDSRPGRSARASS